MCRKLIIIIFSIFPIINSCGTPSSKLGLINDKLSANTKVVSSNIDFSYDCLITDPFASMAFMTYQGEIEAVKFAPENVTIVEENEYGEEMYNKLKDENKFLTKDDRLDALQEMLTKLLLCRNSKSGLEYKIHLIEDETVNAFTAGGHIFVYTGIINYCETESEMAGIIAHEIGHNEKGHINLILKRLKNAGSFGDILLIVKQLTSASFNQFNELEADTYGADLAYAAGYDPVACAKLWKKMAQDHQEDANEFDKFFRTHPYSIDRYNCLKEHILKNYNLNF